MKVHANVVNESQNDSLHFHIKCEIWHRVIFFHMNHRHCVISGSLSVEMTNVER